MMFSNLRTMFGRQPVSRIDYRRYHRHLVRVEQLDERVLLSVSPLDAVQVGSTGYAEPSIATPVLGVISPLVGGTLMPEGYIPAQIENAYGFNQVSLNGAGQTIAIVDAYDDPKFVDTGANGFSSSDLAQFDAKFSLPDPPSFKKISQTGGIPPTTQDPTGTGMWESEEALDVEWAHAIAPDANIVLVEANSNLNSDLYAAAVWAATETGASVVSMSWGAAEYPSETQFDADFLATGVTFVAASGDSGVAWYPAASPNVLGVGGTSLTLNSSGGYGSETTWNATYVDPITLQDVMKSSGGGISAYETQPSYQTGVVTQSTTYRAIPDVSYNAGANGTPTTGYTGNFFSVYDSYNGTTGPWQAQYGTSAGAPQWAGLIALANQQRALVGLPNLNGRSQTLPLIYKMSSSDFNDITTGTNQLGTSASAGYDLVTGRGTPVATQVIAGLSQVDITSISTAVVGSTTYEFGIDGSATVLYNVQSANGTWSGWSPVPGANGDVAIAPAVVGSTVDLFVLSSNSDAYYNALANGAWGSWVSAVPGAAGDKSIAAAVVGSSVDLFFLSANSNVYYNTLTNGSWVSSASSVPGASGDETIATAVVQSTVDLFFLSGNSNVYYNSLTNGSWASGASAVPGASGDTAIATAVLQSTVDLFFLSGNSNVYYNSLANGSWAIGASSVPGATGDVAIGTAVVGSTVNLFFLSGNSKVYYNSLTNGSWGSSASAVTGATGVTAFSAFSEGGSWGIFFIGPGGQVYEWLNGELAAVP